MPCRTTIQRSTHVELIYNKLYIDYKTTIHFYRSKQWFQGSDALSLLKNDLIKPRTPVTFKYATKDTMNQSECNADIIINQSASNADIIANQSV